ncbi:MAG: terminase [Proteobacteria bacterium]|nr:terminase [Pseudomonadota bacterium]NBP16371.1 terminase [bacterium]
MVNKFNKNMEEIFEVTPTVVENSVTVREEKPVVNQEIKLEGDLQKDYDRVRRNYENIIDKGVDAIDTILDIARDSQHPRAFEVAATMIKNVTDANEKLILLQKQMREMNKVSGKESGGTKIDKAIFVGTAADLNKMLKGKE